MGKTYVWRNPKRVVCRLMAFAVAIFLVGGITGFIVGRTAQADEPFIIEAEFIPGTLEETPTEETPIEETPIEEAPIEEAPKNQLVIKSGNNILDPNLFAVMMEMCGKYDVPLALALAVAEQESKFRPGAVSSTNDYGLMQINGCNHGWLRGMGIEPLSSEGNIEAGCLMLGKAIKRYGDYNKALMAYNRGDGGADKLWKQGIYSTEYSRQVMERYHKWCAYLGGA